MLPHSLLTGLALFCDHNGTITGIQRHYPDLLSGICVGQQLADTIDPADQTKLRNFLDALHSEGAIFDWELNVIDRNQVVPLHFAGVKYGLEQVLIIIARTSIETMKLFNDMMRMSNEQTNELRRVIKEKAELSRQQTAHSSALYDELMQVNNEQANLQRELARKTAELERLNALKDQFLGMAAHDLRSPLDVIMTYSTFLMDEVGDQLSSEHREFLGIIQHHSQYMLNLVNHLLDLSIIESGTLMLSRMPVDILPLVRSAVQRNTAPASSKGIRLTFSASVDSLIVSVDADRITQVMTNLLTNAVKFSPKNTEVRVRVTRADDHVELVVQDSGVGISEEQLATLFSPFGRKSNRGTAGEKGTGLGLVIVHKIVSEHGGSLSVDSRAQQGTTFTIRLPILPHDEAL